MPARGIRQTVIDVWGSPIVGSAYGSLRPDRTGLARVPAEVPWPGGSGVAHALDLCGVAIRVIRPALPPKAITGVGGPPLASSS